MTRGAGAGGGGGGGLTHTLPTEFRRVDVCLFGVKYDPKNNPWEKRATRNRTSRAYIDSHLHHDQIGKKTPTKNESRKWISCITTYNGSCFRYAVLSHLHFPHPHKMLYCWPKLPLICQNRSKSASNYYIFFLNALSAVNRQLPDF